MSVVLNFYRFYICSFGKMFCDSGRDYVIILCVIDDNPFPIHTTRNSHISVPRLLHCFCRVFNQGFKTRDFFLYFPNCLCPEQSFLGWRKQLIPCVHWMSMEIPLWSAMEDSWSNHDDLTNEFRGLSSQLYDPQTDWCAH